MSSETNDNDLNKKKPKIKKQRKSNMTTNKTGFLNKMHAMLSDKSNSKAIKWDKEGLSFIIKDMQLFLEIMTKYFKTKNYSSFVRQLNMYDFHKVRDKTGVIAFSHPHFTRDSPNTPDSIHRKNADPGAEKAPEQKAYKSLSLQLQRLRKTYSELEDSFSNISKQNKRLIENNKELVYQMYHFKRNAEIKSRKLLFCFFVLMSRFHPETLALFQNAINQNEFIEGQEQSEQKLVSLKSINQFITKLSHRLIFGKETKDFSLDSLMVVLEQFLSSKTNESVNRKWKDLISNVVLESGGEFVSIEKNPGKLNVDNISESMELLNPKPNFDEHSHKDHLSNWEKESLLNFDWKNLSEKDFGGKLSLNTSFIKEISDNEESSDKFSLYKTLNLASPKK